jgi:hypothetical protein
VARTIVRKKRSGLGKKIGRTALANALLTRYSRFRGRAVIHFLHIGKTGGTAIRHALRRHRTTPRYGLILHDHGTRLMDVPAGDRIVIFLRDPVSRFVSGFHSGQRQGRPRFFVPWTADEAAAFERFATPNELALALSSDDPVRRAHAEEAMHSIRHVKFPLTDWLGSEDYVRSRLPDMFFIGFQETLAADFERLKARLGLAGDVRLPDDDLAAHRNPRHLDTALDPAATRNLERWYAADVHLYQLCRRLPSE